MPAGVTNGQSRAVAVQARYEQFRLLYLGNDPKYAGNATQCALKVGYSPNAAKSQGSQLVSRLNLQDAIRGRSLENLENSLLTEERITKELERIALFDPRKMFAPDGSLLAPHQWSDDVAAGIASIDRDEITAGRGAESIPIGTTSKVRLWDKLQALNTAMKYRGMFERDNRQKAEAIAISVQFSADPNARDGDSAVDVTPTTTPSTPGPATRGRGRK